MAVPTAKLLREYLGENYQESDEELIKLYVETHQFYRKMKAELKKSTLLMEHTNKFGAKNLVKNPLAIELTKTVQTLNNLLKSLGLTPAQRKKIENGGDDDDFDSF
ncbi:P27 family phage terminase small subunit [Gracilibacillus lacisalsi]|uniref:P27 family phage terminase small subunit n=1 Tax=Gracilibacillus lacisalsi TaxID=393087 RepID=UPI000367F74A|nr:P27 family phage terminase small subunit [Gracilibacillus lacisalsi]